jgi:hypothetical protein
MLEHSPWQIAKMTKETCQGGRTDEIRTRYLPTLIPEITIRYPSSGALVSYKNFKGHSLCISSGKCEVLTLGCAYSRQRNCVILALQNLSGQFHSQPSLLHPPPKSSSVLYFSALLTRGWHTKWLLYDWQIKNFVVHKMAFGNAAHKQYKIIHI